MFRILAVIALVGCSQHKPQQGYGFEQVETTESGGKWIDTDGDGTVDQPLDIFCPPAVATGALADDWWRMSASLADAIELGSGYRFKLPESGDVWICEDGEQGASPLRWYCENGLAVVVATGPAGLLAGARVPVWIDQVHGETSTEIPIQAWNDADEYSTGSLIMSGCW